MRPLAGSTRVGIRRRVATLRSGLSARVAATLARSPIVLRVLAVVMVVVMHDRQAVGVIAVHAHASPVPTGSVVPDAPGVGRPRVVVVPVDDQRRGRSVVVAPAPVVGPIHEVAVHVVVPATRPIHARERFDRIGIGVDVFDDDDFVARGQCLVADGVGVGLRRFGVAVRLDDVDFLLRRRLRDHGARGPRCGARRLIFRAADAAQCEPSERSQQTQLFQTTRQRPRHPSSVKPSSTAIKAGIHLFLLGITCSWSSGRLTEAARVP